MLEVRVIHVDTVQPNQNERIPNSTGILNGREFGAGLLLSKNITNLAYQMNYFFEHRNPSDFHNSGQNYYNS